MQITLPEKEIDFYNIINYKMDENIDYKSESVDEDVFEDIQKYALPILDNYNVKVFKLYGDVMRNSHKRVRFKYVIEKLNSPKEVIEALNDKLKDIFNVASATYLKQGTDYMIIIWIGRNLNVKND